MHRINLAAVAVSGVVFWLIQAVWFTVFGDAWIAAVGMPAERVAAAKAHPSFWPYVIALAANILIAYVISKVMISSGAASIGRGMMTAGTLWGGILMTDMLTSNSFEQRPASVTLINGGAALAGMMACGIICGAWKKKA
ncbi:MAG: DUF1761 domain-containing protein [Terriglobales bacterium]|jgi:hypothetical protein